MTRPIVRTTDTLGTLPRGGRTKDGRLRVRSREAKRMKCRDCGTIIYALKTDSIKFTTCRDCLVRPLPAAPQRARPDVDCGACGRPVARTEGTWHHLEEDRDEGHLPLGVMPGG